MVRIGPCFFILNYSLPLSFDTISFFVGHFLRDKRMVKHADIAENLPTRLLLILSIPRTLVPSLALQLPTLRNYPWSQ